MDPHIKTFDARKAPNNWYDMHYPCTFTMVENTDMQGGVIDLGRQIDFGGLEMYGVYAKFSYCWAGVTCVDKITYMDSAETVVDIDTAALHVVHVSIHIQG